MSLGNKYLMSLGIGYWTPLGNRFLMKNLLLFGCSWVLMAYCRCFIVAILHINHVASSCIYLEVLSEVSFFKESSYILYNNNTFKSLIC